jgi:hypothetical protein
MGTLVGVSILAGEGWREGLHGEVVAPACLGGGGRVLGHRRVLAGDCRVGELRGGVWSLARAQSRAEEGRSTGPHGEVLAAALMAGAAGLGTAQESARLWALAWEEEGGEGLRCAS